jgi:hypothetical protein
MFTADRPVQEFDLTVQRRGSEFWAFGWQGVWHIWIGFDHILFLVALLLPSVLTRERDRWVVTQDFRSASINVFKIVTAFTVAHSITLSIASLQLVSLSSRWVETAIAVSVLVAAANNLHPIILGRTWMVAFGFGLVHGFGFATVLTELGLPAGALAAALVGFNLGVEAGQLAIVTLFLPLAYLARASWAYQRIVLVGGSAAIILIAGLWILERAVGFELSAR